MADEDGDQAGAVEVDLGRVEAPLPRRPRFPTYPPLLPLPSPTP